MINSEVMMMNENVSILLDGCSLDAEAGLALRPQLLNDLQEYSPIVRSLIVN